MTARRRVGVFGGTFDPPHLGHVGLAAAALASLELSELWFTPAVPYHKGDAAVPAAHRVAMCEAAAAELGDAASVCTVDVDRGSATYTIDTLTELAAAHPDAELVFVCGSDVVGSLLTWGPDAQRCLDVACFAAVHRRGHDEPRLPAPLSGRLELIDDAGIVEVSSSLLRARLAACAPVDDLVPAGVAAYIDAHGLYRPAACRPSPVAATVTGVPQPDLEVLRDA